MSTTHVSDRAAQSDWGAGYAVPRTAGVKATLRSTALTAIKYWDAARAHGNEVTCPCCGWSFEGFANMGSRPNARCPRCRSLERHRLLWHFLAREGLPRPGAHVLHVAPEVATYNWLRRRKGITYVGADIRPNALTTHLFGVTDIPFPDESFDLIIISHVLEHVPDDRRAMREIGRVLRPEGVAILQHPIEVGRDVTYEDPTITTPEGRDRAFGQFDHVRAYGRDFPDRLTESGLEVRVEDVLATLTPEVIARFRLAGEVNARFDNDAIHVCSKRKRQ